MENWMREIPGAERFAAVTPVEKGWSDDRKYHVTTVDGESFLLRTSSPQTRKRKEFEISAMRRLEGLSIPITLPCLFGQCPGSGMIYMLFPWIEGQDAESVLPSLTFEEQARLGSRAGEILRVLHSLPAPDGTEDWNTRFNRKIDRVLREYHQCPCRLEGDTSFERYIEENRFLLENRPSVFLHGDYHDGNMLITPSHELWIIDFNRLDYGDPWQDFDRIAWDVAKSPAFAVSRIRAYFKGSVPDLFFDLLRLYLCVNQLANLPWALGFGQPEMDAAKKQAAEVSGWFLPGSNRPKWFV